MDFRTTVIKTLLGESVGIKPHPTLSAFDHGHQYTHDTIEDAQSKGEINRNHIACKKDNPHPKGSKEHNDFNAGADKAKADVLKNWS
jgi:hypothetical protein